MGSKNIVSVLLITYNHEGYISQSLDSILSQQGNVLKEIVIAEDFSTDGTRDIIDSYEAKYPDLIKKIYREKNVGLTRNFVDGLKTCSGKYIATLSADDYWIDFKKLEYQSEFLNVNSDFSLISNAALTYFEESQKWHLGKLNATKEERNLFDLFHYNDISAGQAMFRNQDTWEFPEFYFNNRGEDRQLWMILSTMGRLLNDFSRFTGVYRRHSKSITMSREIDKIQGYITRIENNKIWAEFFKVANNMGFKHAQSLYKLKLSKEYLKAYQIKNAIQTLASIENRDVLQDQPIVIRMLSKVVI